MHLFQGKKINQLFYINDPNEIHHCTRVTRHQISDSILITDFAGVIWNGKIKSISDEAIEVEIIDEISLQKESIQVHIAISLTQSSDRFEWFLEKATESGVNCVTPLICTRTENQKNKRDRWEKIILSSAKQCLRPSLPHLNEIIRFKDFLKTSLPSQRYICHCEDRTIDYLGKIINVHNELVILIGPEGDFTKEEIQLAKENQFREVNLGPERLRVETAGIAANIICQTMINLQ